MPNPNPAEDTPSSPLTAGGSAQSEPVQPSAKKTTLDELKKAEETLLASINSLKDHPEKATLLNRATNASVLIGNSDIDQLDDRTSRLEKIVMADGSSGLRAFQKKTREIFNDSLKKMVQLKALDNNNQAAIILQDLANLEAIRSNLLKERLQAETQESSDSANNILMSRFDIKDPKAPKKFIDNLASQQPPILKTKDGHFVKQVDENTFESDDPELLALTLLQAGYKDIEVGGSPPLKVLNTALAALARGANHVSWTEETDRYIRNYHNYSGWGEYLQAMKLYDKVKEVNQATRRARSSSSNGAFNERSDNEISERAKIMKQIDTSKVNPLPEMLAGVNGAKKKAQLAYDLSDENRNGYAEVRSQLKNPVERKQFDQAYNNLVTDKLIEQINGESSTKKNDPEYINSLAKQITKQENKELRQEFYKKIDKLIPFGQDQEKNDAFRNQLRAELMHEIIERHHSSRKLFTAPEGNCQQELKNLFTNLTDDQKRDVSTRFDDDYPDADKDKRYARMVQGGKELLSTQGPTETKTPPSAAEQQGDIPLVEMKQEDSSETADLIVGNTTPPTTSEEEEPDPSSSNSTLGH